MFEYQGRLYEYDLQIGSDGVESKAKMPKIRYVQNMSPFWEKRGYRKGDRIGFPTGVRKQHVDRAKQGLDRARDRFASTSVLAAGNRVAVKRRGWAAGVEEGVRVLRHNDGIVYAWEGDLYAQKKGGRVRKFDSVEGAMTFVESPTPPRKATKPAKAPTAKKPARKPAEPAKAAKKAQTSKKPARTSGPSWTRGSGPDFTSWRADGYGTITRRKRDTRTDHPYRTSDGIRHSSLAGAKEHLIDRKKTRDENAAARRAAKATKPPAKKTAAKTPAKKTANPVKKATQKAAKPAKRATPSKATPKAAEKAPTPSQRSRAEVREAARNAKANGTPMSKDEQEELYRSLMGQYGGRMRTKPAPEEDDEVEYYDSEVHEGEIWDGEIDDEDEYEGGNEVAIRGSGGTVAVPPPQEGRLGPQQQEVVKPPPIHPEMTFEEWSRTYAMFAPYNGMSATALRNAWKRHMGQEPDAPSRLAPAPSRRKTQAQQAVELNKTIIEKHGVTADMALSARDYPKARAALDAMMRRIAESRDIVASSPYPEYHGNTQYWDDYLKRMEAFAATVPGWNASAPREVRFRSQGAATRARQQAAAMDRIENRGARRRARRENKSFVPVLETTKMSASYIAQVMGTIGYDEAKQQRAFNETEFKGYSEKKVHTGAMVALMPRDDDAVELALKGHETPEELHTTLLFLGPADKFDRYTRERIVSAVRTASIGLRRVQGKSFAASVFNPNGKEPCVVLGISGKELTAAHAAIRSSVVNNAFVTPPSDEHSPWVPHVTLAYAEKGNTSGLLKKATEKADGRTVEYDRIRIAFGGDDIIDIELANHQPPALETRLRMLRTGTSAEASDSISGGMVNAGRMNNPRIDR